MRARCGNCAYALLDVVRGGMSWWPGKMDADARTDNAVLATNGFAADGKNFVKRVKQRLEVSWVLP